jgi:predicted ATPase/DNA-binding winged helix-turn-helix (wHTH) protein
MTSAATDQASAADGAPTAVGAEFVFGRFRLSPARQRLLDGDHDVRLGSRALDLLTALVRRAGSTVDKGTLMRSVWPNTVVEEINLRVQITALRKALGDGRGKEHYISTVPGRGYAFVAPVVQVDQQVEARVAPVHPNNLPGRFGKVVGREPAVSALVSQLPGRRFITIVGPGGIGKTTLAVAVAERSLANYKDGAWFVDLAAISDPKGIPGAVASAMGLRLSESGTLEHVAEAMADRQLLLVLDNCEHLAEACAALAEALVRASAGLRVLATSREPLRAEGEWLHRLRPLGLPAADQRQRVASAAEALEWPAVQLFVERAGATLESFQLTDRDADLVLELCRRLDGLPLAIELAAARVDTLGIRGLYEHLEDRLHFLTSGLRTVQPRQRTLRALLDWSHALLPEPARVVFRRVSVFRDAFTLEEGASVAADDTVDRLAIAEQVVALADRSLLSLESDGDTIRYRMLEVTRSYALERLEESGEGTVLRRRHAQQQLTRYRECEQDWQSLSRASWLAKHAARTDDLRAALDWAFGPDGDVEVGIDLTVAVAPLAFELAVLHDFRARLKRAIDALEGLPENRQRDASRLHTALGSLYNHVLGPSEEMSAEYRRAFELTAERQDPKAMCPPIIGLWAQAYAAGEFPEALDWARRLEELAERGADATALTIAHRMMAQAYYMLGDFKRSSALAEAVLRYPQGRFPLAYGPSQTSVYVTMRIVLARIAWVEGRSNDAMAVAEEAIRIAEDEHVFGECLALAMAACPIAIWRGDMDQARRDNARLRHLTRMYSSPYWQAWADGFEYVLDPSGRAPPRYDAMRYDTFATLDPGLLSADSVTRVSTAKVGWSAAEVLRVQALQIAPLDSAGAEALLRQALAQARAQNAAAWELRSAISLCELRRGDVQAIDDLRGVLSKLPQVEGTRDGRRAAELLAG